MALTTHLVLLAPLSAHAGASGVARCERAFLPTSSESLVMNDAEAVATALISRLSANNRKIEKVGPNSFRPDSDTELMHFFSGRKRQVDRHEWVSQYSSDRFYQWRLDANLARAA